jgi:hypothetical protein
MKIFMEMPKETSGHFHRLYRLLGLISQSDDCFIHEVAVDDQITETANIHVAM